MEDCRQRQFCRRILGSGEGHVRKGAMMTKIESFQGFDDHLSRQPSRGFARFSWGDASKCDALQPSKSTARNEPKVGQNECKSSSALSLSRLPLCRAYVKKRHQDTKQHTKAREGQGRRQRAPSCLFVRLRQPRDFGSKIGRKVGKTGKGGVRTCKNPRIFRKEYPDVSISQRRRN
jgi:hypothetical protein